MNVSGERINEYVNYEWVKINKWWLDECKYEWWITGALHMDWIREDNINKDFFFFAFGNVTKANYKYRLY